MINASLLDNHTNDTIATGVHLRRSGETITMKFRTATVQLSVTGAAELARALQELSQSTNSHGG